MALINAVVPFNTPKQRKLPSAEPDLGVFTGPINFRALIGTQHFAGRPQKGMV